MGVNLSLLIECGMEKDGCDMMEMEENGPHEKLNSLSGLDPCTH